MASWIRILCPPVHQHQCWLTEEESSVSELDRSSLFFRLLDVCHSKLESAILRSKFEFFLLKMMTHNNFQWCDSNSKFNFWWHTFQSILHFYDPSSWMYLPEAIVPLTDLLNARHLEVINSTDNTNSPKLARSESKGMSILDMNVNVWNHDNVGV